MTPAVTVLLAVKDGEPWIRRAVESVLGQTYRDLELLVVDDASTDSTVATVESFGDPRVRVLRNERNLGQAPSLNLGLTDARGRYVARLDHDDWCLPTRIERQVELLEREPRVGLVGSWLRLVDDEDRTVGEMRAELADHAEYLYETLTMNVLVSHPAAMYRREDALAVGAYEARFAPAEDKDLWRKLALAGHDARIVQEQLVVYRLHGAQLSQTQAAYQRQVDQESQELFLAAVAPDAPVRAVRQLLADDPAFWREQRSVEQARAAAAGVDAVLAGLRERLALDERTAGRLEELVALRVQDVVRRGWRHDPLGWSAAAPAFGDVPRSLAVAAPLRFLVRRAGRDVARELARAAPLVRLRGPALRSRFVRAVYSRMVGSR